VRGSRRDATCRVSTGAVPEARGSPLFFFGSLGNRVSWLKCQVPEGLLDLSGGMKFPRSAPC
jgi:hypothetical protein